MCSCGSSTSGVHAPLIQDFHLQCPLAHLSALHMLVRHAEALKGCAGEPLSVPSLPWTPTTETTKQRERRAGSGIPIKTHNSKNYNNCTWWVIFPSFLSSVPKDAQLQVTSKQHPQEKGVSEYSPAQMPSSMFRGMDQATVFEESTEDHVEAMQSSTRCWLWPSIMGWNISRKLGISNFIARNNIPQSPPC